MALPNLMIFWRLLRYRPQTNGQVRWPATWFGLFGNAYAMASRQQLYVYTVHRRLGTWGALGLYIVYFCYGLVCRLGIVVRGCGYRHADYFL